MVGNEPWTQIWGTDVVKDTVLAASSRPLEGHTPGNGSDPRHKTAAVRRAAVRYRNHGWREAANPPETLPGRERERPPGYGGPPPCRPHGLAVIPPWTPQR